MKKIRELLIEYYKNKGVPRYRENIITDYFKDKFNPSVGHTTLYDKIYKNLNGKSEKFFLSDLSIRDIDAGKVGYSIDHLTSFLMHSVFYIDSLAERQNQYLALWREVFEILSILGINKDELFFTVNAGSKFMNNSLEKDILSYDILTQEFGIGEQHILYIPDNIISADEDEITGPIVEIFVKRGSYPVEIGTVVRGEYKVLSREGKDVMVEPCSMSFSAAAFGIERLNMLVKGENNIFNVSPMSNLMDVIISYTKASVKKYLLSDMEIFFSKDLYVMTDHLKTLVVILNEGIRPKYRGYGKRLKKMLRKVQSIDGKYDFLNVEIIDKFINIIEYHYDLVFKLTGEEVLQLIKNEGR